jgi:DDE superfamily endonuclease
VRTTRPEAAAAARIGAGLGRRKRAELLELLRPCFARVEPWLQAGKYAAALMSDLPRRNGWTLAERAGDRTPDRMQRLLSRAVWDAFAVMRAVRRFAVAGLDQAACNGGRRGLAVGAIDETSQVKQGERTAGVKRHYLGCAGKVANGITTVHLAYAREGTGHALIAARQWVPSEHLEDPGGPLGRSQRQGPALVRLGLAGHRPAPGLPAHPPSPGHRRAAFHYCFVPDGQPVSLARLSAVRRCQDFRRMTPPV